MLLFFSLNNELFYNNDIEDLFDMKFNKVTNYVQQQYNKDIISSLTKKIK